MTKQEKIDALAKAMTQSVRGASKDGQLDPDGEQYYHFTDSAPEELKNIYLEHYEVRDIDYETFSAACDIVRDIYDEQARGYYAKDADIEEAIYERASDSASVYTAACLAYINIWNQNEITDILKGGVEDIATAAAIWYDRQVEQAAIIINEWINSK